MERLFHGGLGGRLAMPREQSAEGPCGACLPSFGGAASSEVGALKDTLSRWLRGPFMTHSALSELLQGPSLLVRKMQQPRQSVEAVIADLSRPMSETLIAQVRPPPLNDRGAKPA